AVYVPPTVDDHTMGGPGNDTILVNGTSGDDIFSFAMGGVDNKDLIIQYRGAGAGSPVVSSVYRDFANQSIEQIVVTGNFGDDKFLVDESGGGVPLPPPVQGRGGGGFPPVFCHSPQTTASAELRLLLRS